MANFEILSEKEKAQEHYKATVSAWFTISLERDKSLLTLSIAAIGLLITLITKTEIVSTCAILIMFVLSMLSFFLCAFFVLKGMRENSSDIAKFLKNQEREKKGEFLHDLADWAFFAGIILFIFIGIFSAINSYEENSRKNLNLETLNCSNVLNEQAQNKNPLIENQKIEIAPKELKP
jgi:hypothetical protein